jgi:predicted  nucleic acid-binding Zn-ribbon protein
MAACINCGHSFNKERVKIGYKTCLNCGDKNASKLIREKASRCMPAFNKGGFQYVQDVKTIGMWNRKEKK